MQTYRSPAGFGIRLDGATAYSGAQLVPFYDSLLVKLTAWDNTLPAASRRADRALREFRIRGVKTNIPFLENVVNHPQFQAGETTTGFLAERPELFHFVRRRDRATRLLRYVGDVIINGNPHVAGKPRPETFETPFMPKVHHGEAAPAVRGPSSRARSEKIRRVGARRKAPDGDRHHLPRRAPVAAGHARPHRGSA
ncbi:MAG: hypothetical protein R2724_04060 [Bryobacterales bacterium]